MDIGAGATRLAAEPKPVPRPTKRGRRGGTLDACQPSRSSELSKHYGDVTAVDDLSFVAREGAVTGFLGPNGAGKTTTLRMLLGLVAPTGGTATIGGRPYGELDGTVAPRRRGARVDRLLPGPARARPPARAGHRGRAARHPRRRGARAGRPRPTPATGASRASRSGCASASAWPARSSAGRDVLILDEPANGLDPEGVHWLRGFLRAFADDGGTVLVSSHLLAEIAQTVDDVVIIARGRLVVQSLAGRPDAALAHRRPRPHAAAGGAALGARRARHRRRASRRRHARRARDARRRPSASPRPAPASSSTR